MFVKENPDRKKKKKKSRIFIHEKIYQENAKEIHIKKYNNKERL